MELDPSTIHLSIVPFPYAFPVDHYDALRKLLPDEEQESVTLAQSGKQRSLRSLCAHALARVKFGELFGLSASEVPVHFPFDHKPVFDAGFRQGNSPFYFSLAHCEDFLVLGYGSRPVGVDVEPVEIDFPFQETARHLFSEAEIEDLEFLPVSRRVLRFHELWTLKEAMIKAGDFSFPKDMNRSSFRVKSDSDIEFAHADEGQDATETQWKFYLKRPSIEHVLAVGVQSEREVNIQEQYVSLDQLFS